MANFIRTRGQRSKDVPVEVDDLTDFEFMRHQVYYS